MNSELFETGTEKPVVAQSMGIGSEAGCLGHSPAKIPTQIPDPTEQPANESRLFERFIDPIDGVMCLSADATAADIATKSLTLAATASSGGAVTYSTTTPDNCSISGSTLNLLKAGNCVVTATQSGTSTLAPISANATITLTGVVVTPKPVVTKKTIVCVKGKTTKKVSGTNPKCPKGYKVKK